MYSGTSSTRSSAECSFIAFWDIQQTTNEACNGEVLAFLQHLAPGVSPAVVVMAFQIINQNDSDRFFKSIE